MRWVRVATNVIFLRSAKIDLKWSWHRRKFLATHTQKKEQKIIAHYALRYANYAALNRRLVIYMSPRINYSCLCMMFHMHILSQYANWSEHPVILKKKSQVFPPPTIICTHGKVVFLVWYDTLGLDFSKVSLGLFTAFRGRVYNNQVKAAQKMMMKGLLWNPMNFSNSVFCVQ